MAATFDGTNRLIILPANGSAWTLDVQVDLYSDWKEFVKIGDNAKYAPAFRTIAGDDLDAVAGLSAAPYFFIRNDLGWRIRPAEEDATINVIGNLIPEDSTVDIIVPTLGGFTVLLPGLQPVTQVAGRDEVHVTIGYDGTTITVGAWLQRNNVHGVANVATCVVDWYDDDGALIFSASDSAPDAQGQFKVVQTETLLDDVAYYADVTITSPGGPVSTRKGAPTVATT